MILIHMSIYTFGILINLQILSKFKSNPSALGFSTLINLNAKNPYFKF